MNNNYQPIVITCGDPAGVGPEVAVSAWKALRDEIPLCILIDPSFVPQNINIKTLDHSPRASDIERNSLTVIRHKFVEHRVPGEPNPKNAGATIKVIERGVQFVKKGRSDRKKLIRRKNKIFKPLTPIQYRYCDVFRRLGFPVDLVNHEYPVKPFLDNDTEEQKLLSSCQNKKIIGIAPFASFQGKSYPLDLMQNVIAYLQKSHSIYLFGGGENELKQIKIWDRAYENVFDVSKNFNLGQQLNIMNYIDLMISMDSANGHLAANCGVPVLTIWGMTHPFCGFTPFDQAPENSIVIDRNLYPAIPTSIFGNNVPKGYSSAFRTIEPKEIIEKALKILENPKPRHN